jgi:hypothetical protein
VGKVPVGSPNRIHSLLEEVLLSLVEHNAGE